MASSRVFIFKNGEIFPQFLTLPTPLLKKSEKTTLHKYAESPTGLTLFLFTEIQRKLPILFRNIVKQWTVFKY